MKTALYIALSIISMSSWAETLKLSEQDQIKLGEVLDRLSSEVADEDIKTISNTSYEKTIKFPIKKEEFQIACLKTYFNNSPYPSFTNCVVDIDLNHQNLDKSYDELRVTIQDENIRSELFKAIPFGRKIKELYSFGSDEGIRYNGKKGDIFHYYISCNASKCTFTFSEKALVN